MIDGDNDLVDEEGGRANKGDTSKVEGMGEDAKGMVLPFKPLNITFSHMWYSVDFPKVSFGMRYCCPSRFHSISVRSVLQDL